MHVCMQLTNRMKRPTGIKVHAPWTCGYCVTCLFTYASCMAMAISCKAMSFSSVPTWLCTAASMPLAPCLPT